VSEKRSRKVPKWRAGLPLKRAKARELFPRQLRRAVRKLSRAQMAEIYGEVEIGGRVARGRRGVGRAAVSWKGEPRAKPRLRWLEETMRRRFAALVEALDAEAEAEDQESKKAAVLAEHARLAPGEEGPHRQA